MASALAELHALSPGLVVLDLKPANLLLDEAGRAVIADFGISRLAQTTLQSQTQSVAGGGTPAFMAPETLAPAQYGRCVPSK